MVIVAASSCIKSHCVDAFFKEEVKLAKMDENAYASGHIMKECIFVDNNLKCVAKASTRDQPYSASKLMNNLYVIFVFTV